MYGLSREAVRVKVKVSVHLLKNNCESQFYGKNIVIFSNWCVSTQTHKHTSHSQHSSKTINIISIEAATQSPLIKRKTTKSKAIT